MLLVVRGVFTFLNGRWTEVASQNVAYDLRNAIHDKLQSLSFSYHDRAETGQLLTRAISDVDRIRFLTGRAVLRVVEVITLVLGIGASMFVLNPRLALLTLLMVPFLIYTAIHFGLRFRPISRAIQKQVDDLTTRIERLSAPVAAERLTSSVPPLLLDVRSPHEYGTKRIQRAENIPLNHLRERLEELPRDRPIVVHCAGGYRSSIAASLLESQGFSQVSEIAGGVSAWETAQLPVEGGTG